MAERMDFVIVGAGAIGAIVGAHLIQAGHGVRFVEANAAHVAAIRANGLRLSGAIDTVVYPPVFGPDEFDWPIERLLLAVKSRDTVAALEPLVPLLAPDGYVVSLQNGLEEAKIAALVGAARTIGAYLTFGGHYREPGHVVYGGTGSFKLGELDGRTTARVEALREALSHQQPVEVTDNIQGWLWAKLALGAVYFGTAIVDAPVPDIYDDARARAVLERFAAEAAAVAGAVGVRIEDCDGFDAKAFGPGSPPEAAAASWDAQRRYWAGHVSTHTGVWRDLKVHRRRTELEWQVGAILRAAHGVGVPVPHLERLNAAVERIETGAAPQSWDTLYAIAQEAR